MNANQIYPGSEYAVFPQGKTKGDRFVPGATRVRVMGVFKKQEYGKMQKTAYVCGIRLTRDGEPFQHDNGTLHEYRAYDVAEDWDEYDDRWQEFEAEQEAREAKRKAEQDEWQRQYEARKQAQLEERERAERERLERQRKFEESNAIVKRALYAKGLKTEGIRFDGLQVHIPREELFRWLGVSHLIQAPTLDLKLKN